MADERRELFKRWMQLEVCVLCYASLPQSTLVLCSHPVEIMENATQGDVWYLTCLWLLFEFFSFLGVFWENISHRLTLCLLQFHAIFIFKIWTQKLRNRYHKYSNSEILVNSIWMSSLRNFAHPVLDICETAAQYLSHLCYLHVTSSWCEARESPPCVVP